MLLQICKFTTVCRHCSHVQFTARKVSRRARVAAIFMQCQDGQSISRRHRCDGKFDCDDGSDETFGCKRRRKRSVCSPSKYECANRRCIPTEHVCNGDNDCLDFSDELACPPTTATAVDKKKKSPPPPPPPPPLPMTTTTMTSTPQPCAHNDFQCANNERCTPTRPAEQIDYITLIDEEGRRLECSEELRYDPLAMSALLWQCRTNCSCFLWTARLFYGSCKRSPGPLIARSIRVVTGVHCRCGVFFAN